MKINKINEAIDPPLSSKWTEFDTPLRHGDTCPVCGRTVTNRYRRMGPPEFVGCINNHAFPRDVKPRVGRPDEEDLSPEELDKLFKSIKSAVDSYGRPKSQELKHTCKRPPKSDEDVGQARRNRAQCAACNALYERSLEAGFEGGEEVGEVKPGEVSEVPPPTGVARKLSKPGAFGTGRPAPYRVDEPVALRALKTLRDMGAKEWSRRGEGRFGERVREKARCAFGHTCWDPSVPMPDPFVKGRHSSWFVDAEVDDPVYRVEWPVSGLSGKKPRSEYAQMVYSKLRCPVCSGREKGCENRVSTEFGKPKKFCSEHTGESPYPKELLGKFGGEGLPGAPEPSADARSAEGAWREFQARGIKPGDRVMLVQRHLSPNDWPVGTVSEVDPGMEDRTHRVVWDNPKTPALKITWVDPKSLDVVDPNSEG